MFYKNKVCKEIYIRAVYDKLPNKGISQLPSLFLRSESEEHQEPGNQVLESEEGLARKLKLHIDLKTIPHQSTTRYLK